MILAISGHEFLVYRTQDYTSEARRIRLYLSCIYLVRIPHILSGGNISLRGCVNPASWLLLDARASFAQPLNEKYPLQSRLSNLRTSLGNYNYKSFSLLAQTSFWGKKILSLVAKKF